ncbi:MAG: NifU family protein [Actinomycetes bacterium]|jgi:Fe-S cluster biogenesis protein NfuA|nr:NifU family protein [Actinomycetes bacterium]
MAVDRAQVEAVIETIRPRLQADGGDIALIDVSDDGGVTVQLQGACRGCPMAQLTLASQVECVLKEKVPGVTHIIPA